MNYDEKKNYLKMLDANIRPDGREKETYRKIVIETGVSSTAEGSARVTIGDTMVMAGVKMEIGKPFDDTPDEGVLMVGVELSPIANNEFESGPPNFDSIELARVTDRGIRESKSFDPTELCIKEGEKVWMVNVDLVVLNDDGNLFDACGLAAMAALRTAKFPETDKAGKVDYTKLTNKSVSLNKIPLGVTVLKFGTHLVIDPTLQETKGFDARLTVCSTEDGKLCALQKGGSDSLTSEDVAKMVELGIAKAKDLRKLLP